MDEANQVPEAAAAKAPAEFMPLDPRVITLWRVTRLIGFGILLLLSLFGSLIAGWAAPASLVGMLAGWLALAVLLAWLIWQYPPRAYRMWSYRVDDRVLETRSGVWFRVIKLLPLSRLQHVDLRRGPLERSQGLASLVLHTAGTREAALIIPGLEAEEAVRLRDRLVSAGGDDAV